MSTTAAPPRHHSLDVLRGIAILGTLATNIWIFTDPAGLVGYITEPAQAEGVSGWVQRVLEQCAQGKFLGLLTIMFGIGLAIQQRSALRRGAEWPGNYRWRAALLLLDGVVNFLFVIEFDVLMGYAVTGFVVAFVLATSERAQRRWLITAAAVHCALLTLVVAALLAADRTGGSEPLDPNPYADGSWWDLVIFRMENIVLFRFEPVFILALSIALFLVGARLYNAEVLGDNARLRKRLMLAGLTAVPVDFALGLFGGGAGLIVGRYGTAPVVSLGILGLVAEFYARRRRLGWPGTLLSDVGRTALSCYVLQNVIASIVCYGWAFGLADDVSDSARVPFTVALYLAVCSVVIVSARLWLRRFDRGPVEWLWNASYRRMTDRSRASRAMSSPRTA